MKPTSRDAITLLLAALIGQGADPIDALKLVCGSDAVREMIDTLYAELRAKAVSR